ncbi:MAG: hypothetical protein IPH76_08210 [Xanthomonadales bacterium]|nr:hypothetical protein [Xanthomonadales bacterium]
MASKRFAEFGTRPSRSRSNVFCRPCTAAPGPGDQVTFDLGDDIGLGHPAQ